MHSIAHTAKNALQKRVLDDPCSRLLLVLASLRAHIRHDLHGPIHQWTRPCVSGLRTISVAKQRKGARIGCAETRGCLEQNRPTKVQNSVPHTAVSVDRPTLVARDQNHHCCYIIIIIISVIAPAANAGASAGRLVHPSSLQHQHSPKLQVVW